MISVFKTQCVPPQPIQQSAQRKVFIVIEGTHNSGRNNMLRRLAQTYQGYALENPPRCMAQLKNFFLGTKHERKAFLMLSNYAMSFDIQSVWHMHPVFLVAYYYDQAAFNIAWGFNNDEDMPKDGSNIYNWPFDLVVPDLIVFLNAHLNVRNRFATSKGTYSFQKKIVTAFERFSNPPVYVINTTHFFEDSFNIIKSKIQTDFAYDLTVNNPFAYNYK